MCVYEEHFIISAVICYVVNDKEIVDKKCTMELEAETRQYSTFQ